MRLWTESGKEKQVADWLTDTLGDFLAAVRYGDSLQEFLDTYDSHHANWGSVVCFANQSVAVCKDYWLVRDGRIHVPIAEHGTDSEADRVVPMWTMNVAPNHAAHCEFGKHVVATVEASRQ